MDSNQGRSGVEPGQSATGAGNDSLGDVRAAFARIAPFDPVAKAQFFEAAWRERGGSVELLAFAVEALSPVAACRPALVRIVQSAVEQNIPYAAGQLVRLEPQLVPPGALASLLNSESPNERLQGALVLLAQGNGADAVEVARDSLGTPGSPLPAAEMIGLAFHALWRKDLRSGRALASLLREHLERAHDQAALSGGLAARWSALNELLAASERVPIFFVRDAAAVMLGQVPNDPNVLAGLFFSIPGMPQGADMVAWISQNAPALSTFLNLQAPLQEQQEIKSRRGYHITGGAALAALVVILKLTKFCAREAADEDNERSIAAARAAASQVFAEAERERQIARQQAELGKEVEATLASAQKLADVRATQHQGDVVCGASRAHPTRVQKKECRRVEQIAQIFGRDDCPSPADLATRPTDSPDLVRFLELARSLADEVCRP